MLGNKPNKSKTEAGIPHSQSGSPESQALDTPPPPLEPLQLQVQLEQPKSKKRKVIKTEEKVEGSQTSTTALDGSQEDNKLSLPSENDIIIDKDTLLDNVFDFTNGDKKNLRLIKGANVIFSKNMDFSCVKKIIFSDPENPSTITFNCAGELAVKIKIGPGVTATIQTTHDLNLNGLYMDIESVLYVSDQCHFKKFDVTIAEGVFQTHHNGESDTNITNNPYKLMGSSNWEHDGQPRDDSYGSYSSEE